MLTLTEMALQPQLADAAGAGVPGVCYWQGHRAGWTVTAPKDHPRGMLAPADTDVHCYSICDGDGEHFVFAENVETATAYFAHWCIIADGSVDEELIVREMSPWLLQGPLVTLREDMEAGLLGIGLPSVDDFWHIYPADYEPSFER